MPLQWKHLKKKTRHIPWMYRDSSRNVTLFFLQKFPCEHSLLPHKGVFTVRGAFECPIITRLIQVLVQIYAQQCPEFLHGDVSEGLMCCCSGCSSNCSSPRCVWRHPDFQFRENVKCQFFEMSEKNRFNVVSRICWILTLPCLLFPHFPSFSFHSHFVVSADCGMCRSSSTGKWRGRMRNSVDVYLLFAAECVCIRIYTVCYICI